MEEDEFSLSSKSSATGVQNVPAMRPTTWPAVGGSKDSSKSSAVGGSVDQDAKVISTKEKCIEAAKKETLEDGELLKGRVPQEIDWRECWAESTEQMSFHKQARLRSKKKSRHVQNLRTIRRKQVRIMAEARREVIREDLRRAKFICLAMDDRQYQKIIRFRCDAPKKPFVRRGVLGVMSLANSSIQDFEEDHALIAVRKLDAFLNRFCTPFEVGRWRFPGSEFGC